MNDVSLNRRFVETDDDEEADQLLSLPFNAYYKIVFKAVSRMRRNHPDTIVDPDEITSDTFIIAFKKRKEIQEPEKLVEWLVRIAENLMIDEIRKSGQKRRLPVVSVGTVFDVEEEESFASTLVETDTEQVEAHRYLVARLLRLLQDTDREIVALKGAELSAKEIAELIGSTTPEAAQQRWERIRKWLKPIARNLDALINCLRKEKDRWIIERYLDGQPLSVITEALGVSPATVERTVKRVRAQWKTAARENPTDPVSTMVNDGR